jgi:hypothetical protein
MWICAGVIEYFSGTLETPSFPRGGRISADVFLGENIYKNEK